jgi:putative membrane protein insertion efficiency factor
MLSICASVWHWPQQGMILLVKAYRLLLKPWLGQACRFEPTCSQYALTALEHHGAVVGASLSAGRLLRCHPWCHGGLDDVPHHAPRLFRSLGLGAPDPRTQPQPEPASGAKVANPQEVSP